MGLVLALAGIAVLAFMAYVRLAPVAVEDWHVDLAAVGFDPAAGQMFCVTRANGSGLTEDPSAALGRLDAIALGTPRTERLAGSVGEGRITWVTRTRLMGYPDYTTAQVMADKGLCVFGRQRFGHGDWGVNAARIGAWMQALLGLPEPPDMTGPVGRP